MGLFSRKRKTSIEDFCQDFYDSFFYGPIKGIDAVSVLFDTAFGQVAAVDRAFATVDRDLFRQEMTSLRIELFGLALMHYFKGKKLEYCLREISFTKKYLESVGKTEIWDIMVFYNKTIARSGHEIATGERERRAWTVSLNEFKLDLCEKFRKETEFDPECIARVMNRFGTDVAWEKKITLELLTALCASRSACISRLDPEALFRLSLPIYGMYNGAMDGIKSVGVVF